jgi:hypothetical protein
MHELTQNRNLFLYLDAKYFKIGIEDDQISIVKILLFMLTKDRIKSLKYYASEHGINCPEIVSNIVEYFFGPFWMNKWTGKMIVDNFCNTSNNYVDENNAHEIITPRKLFEFICQFASSNFDFINYDALYEYLENDLISFVSKCTDYVKNAPCSDFFCRIDNVSLVFVTSCTHLLVGYKLNNNYRSVYLETFNVELLNINEKIKKVCLINLKINKKILSLFAPDIAKLKKGLPNLDFKIESGSHFNTSMDVIDFPLDYEEN